MSSNSNNIDLLNGKTEKNPQKNGNLENFEPTNVNCQQSKNDVIDQQVHTVSQHCISVDTAESGVQEVEEEFQKLSTSNDGCETNAEHGNASCLSDKSSCVQESSDSNDVDSSVSEVTDDDSFFEHAHYHSIEYWNKRYNLLPEAYDWLQSYHDIAWALYPLLKPDSKILIIGCGNADFSADMYDEGYENITNIDLSPVVVEQMKEEHGNIRPNMEFIVMDATNMQQLEENSFDLVLDKGLLDTLVCYSDSSTAISQMFSESCRVLKPTGAFVLISLHTNHENLAHFHDSENSELPWQIAVSKSIRNPQKQEDDAEASNSHSFIVVLKNDAEGEEYDYDAVEIAEDGTEIFSYAKCIDLLYLDAVKRREELRELPDEELEKIDLADHVYSLLTDEESENEESDVDAVNYGDKSYWNERYAADSEPFDWLIEYEHFKDGVSSKIDILQDKSARVFIAGCGNAMFSSDMYDDGFRNIVNVDISDTVIEQMKTANTDRSEMKWILGDVTDMKALFHGGSFDVCIDKSTLDCLFCRTNANTEMNEFLQETVRLLTCNETQQGVYVCISLHTPSKVLPILSEIDWEIEHFPLPNPRHVEGDERAPEYFVFICKTKYTPEN